MMARARWNKKMEPCVYLAGPMTGLTMDEARKWRSIVAKVLASRQIKTLDPTRRDAHVPAGQSISGNVGPADAEAIMQADLDDIRRSTIMLAYLNTPTVSLGTSWELGHATTLGKDVIVAAPNGLRNHPFVIGNRKSVVFASLAAAVRHIVAEYGRAPA